jgi:methionyl-tRNA synthetase
MSKKVYITTTLPYVNSEPHIGFAMEIIRADVIARYKRLLGHDVFFNTGTDEHGAKIYENAVKEKVDVKAYVDGYAEKFRELTNLLNIEKVNFIRTTDEKHIRAAQEMWKRCFDNGYIYKKNYQGKYCVGCELEKTDSELEGGKCPFHPNRDIEPVDEENYFFAMSKFSGRGHKDSLLDFYEKNPEFVVPDFRYNEIKAFVERGLEDFSISRLKEKMPWGVPVPGDDAHVMYVWFDALTSYISTLGWPSGEDFKTFWEQNGEERRRVMQYCGKDNLRQQSAMWQAMLMAAGLPNSTKIVIDGFIISGGQKMSKSIGNVISPLEVIEMFRGVTDYPEEVLRFILLHDVSSFEDGDITIDSIKASYTAHLANGLGNLTSRIMKLSSTRLINPVEISRFEGIESFGSVHRGHLDNFEIKHFIEEIYKDINLIDENIATTEPFKVIKLDKSHGEKLIVILVESLARIANLLSIAMPQTSEKILECIRENKMPEKPLFNRLP